MATLANTFLLSLLPWLLLGCNKTKDTKSMAALKMHIAQQGEQGEQMKQSSPEDRSGEAWITDDMNEGVRPPSAHEAWQPEQGSKNKPDSDADKKTEALQRIRQAIHSRHPTSGKSEGKQITHPPLDLIRKADGMIKSGQEKQAMELYLDLCQSGEIGACHRFGFYLSRTGNQAGASQFYQMSCQQGLSKSCNNLGWEAEKSGDLAKAVDFYSWACLRHHPGSCQNLRRANDKLKDAGASRPQYQLR